MDMPLPDASEAPDRAALEGRVRALAHQVAELQRQNEELRRLAHHDPLTGLPNRRLLADRLKLGMARARRGRQTLAVCCLDLDGFKAVNDAYGHAAGDSLLVTLARRLEQAVRAEETVARVGGDEFVLLLHLDQPDEYAAVLDRVLAALAEPVVLGDGTLQVTASAGHAFYPGPTGDGIDGDTLLRLADRAMYRAKHRARVAA
ncbi:diguanylate cyclase domain-containing protein [Leptothrix sp. BB-4]